MPSGIYIRKSGVVYGGFKKGFTPWNKGKKGVQVYGEEFRLMISKRFKGKKLSEEHRKNLSISHKGQKGIWLGKKMSEQHRKNLSVSHKGYVASEEQRKKMSESHKEYHCYCYHRKFYRKVVTSVD